jgi:DNA-binding transcriptional regulator YiaG
LGEYRKKSVDIDPAEIRRCREALGLSQREFARVLGYAHYNRVSALENGKETVSPAVARLIDAYMSGYRPDDWPEGDGAGKQEAGFYRQKSADISPETVRECRLALGLVQKDFARLLGYSHARRISMIENGKERISRQAVRLMEAYTLGYRPKDWPIAN